jgi:hypothetical protein
MDRTIALEHSARETLWVAHRKGENAEDGKATPPRHPGKRIRRDVRQRDLSWYGLAASGDGRKESGCHGGLR